MFTSINLPNTSSDAQFQLTGDLIAVKSLKFGSVFTKPVTEVIAHNLSFDLPFAVDTTRRISEVKQTISADGITLTLDRVAVTPSEAVLFMPGSKDPRSRRNDFQGDLWPGDVQFNAGIHQSATSGGIYSLSALDAQQTGKGQFVVFCPASLLGGDDKGTLTIQKVMVGITHTDTAEEHQGPWAFQFTLDPPTNDPSPLARP